MTPEFWQRIENIFSVAVELDAAARGVLLDKACGDDHLLREEVESLLAHRNKPVSILDAPPLDRAFSLLVDAEPLIGRDISHYRIVARLAAGGMGEVYLAEDMQLGRKVALKLLSASVTKDASRVRRFEREARAASALNHPGIVTVHEIGQSDHLHFIAMEFIQGETLRERLNGGKIPPTEALEITIQIAAALGAAHQAGIVHRDVKPENIMVRDDGYVKVLDFGIALLAEQPTLRPDSDPGPIAVCSNRLPEPIAESHTEPGTILGTLSYMSPEQARGEPLDQRTDLFSLGVLLYEMLTGRRPFERENRAAVIQALLSEEPLAVSLSSSSVPVALDDLVSRALRKDAEQRYTSAAEMVSDLKDLKSQIEREPMGGAGRPAKAVRAADEQVAGRATFAAWKRERILGTLRRFAPRLLALGCLALLAAGTDAWLIGHWRPIDTVLLLFATLCALAFAYSHRRISPTHFASSRASCFRGLAPFEEGDRGLFCGRDRDVSALLDMIGRKNFRFGVLYGESGSGKTSLLMAGLVPALKEKGYKPIYCRSYADPIAELIEECRDIVQPRPVESEPLTDYLERVAAQAGSTIVVLFDQFEEFFINFPARRDRAAFVSLVADCYRSAALPAKLLFSIRSDFLYLITSAFDNRIPEPLMGDKRYHLRSFDEEVAREVIGKSAEGAGMPLEPALCRQMAHDLAVDDTVLPSELQIVGEQLQSRGIRTLDEYRRAGGKDQLVHGFVEDVIETCKDREGARLVLRGLISDDNTRLTLPIGEIAKRTQRSKEAVEAVLELFVRSRLVRVIQEAEPWRYELIHEYLIGKINEITGKVMDARQRANRSFRQYLSNFAVDKRTRIPLATVWLIRRYSDLDRTGQAQELLEKSLRRGLGKATALALALATIATLAAAALSVSDEWAETRLSDGHRAAARRAVFSPDGGRLVSVSEDKTVIVWDFARRERIATLTGHTDRVGAVAYSPDGRWFATGSDDKTLIVWDASRLEEAVVLRAHKYPVTALAFSPDSTLLASASSTSYGADYRTILWRVGTWEIVNQLPEGAGDARNLLFTPDGHWFIAAGGTALRLDAISSEPSKTALEGVMAVSPDGRWIVANAEDVYFWRCPRRFDPTRIKLLGKFLGHKDNARAAAFAPDSHLAATGSEDIILWDVPSKKQIVHLECSSVVWSLVFSPDGKSLVSTHGDGSILLWDVSEGRQVANFNGHCKPVRSVAFSPDGRRIASGSEDGSVIIWDARDGTKEAVLQGHASRITGVAFSARGNILASCDYRGKAIVWDVEDERPASFTKAPEAPAWVSYGIAVSSDGTFVATSKAVFRAETGEIVFDLLNASPAYGVAFSPDGSLLAACVPDHCIVALYETSTWKTVGLVEDKGISAISVAFSPDGKFLATGDDQWNVRLWQASPLRQVGVVGRHQARIKSVAFSSDGEQVASSGDDGVISLWDVGSRRLITQIGAHSAPVLSVAFSPDGKHLVSGEGDHTVRSYTRHRTLWGWRVDSLPFFGIRSR
jgi:WD40 repeat protein/predicted Ser/Thr protein kinase